MRTNYIVPVFPVYTSHKRPKIHRSSLSQYGFTHPKIWPRLCQGLNSQNLSTVPSGALRICRSVESLPPIIKLFHKHSLHLFTPLKPLPWGHCFPSHFQIIVTLSSLNKTPSLFSLDALIFSGWSSMMMMCLVVVLFRLQFVLCGFVYAISSTRIIIFLGLRISTNLEIFLALFLQSLPPTPFHLTPCPLPLTNLFSSGTLIIHILGHLKLLLTDTCGVFLIIFFFICVPL